MFIPLNLFVDRTTPLAPLGMLDSSMALRSAMRDVLSGFSSQKIVDFRFRDNADRIMGGLSFNAGLLYDEGGKHQWTFNSGSNADTLLVDDDGLYTSRTAAYLLTHFHADYAGTPHKITAFNPSGRRVVMALALKVTTAATPGLEGNFLFVDTTSGNADKLGWYFNYSSNVLLRRSGPGYGTLKTLAAGDLNKWHLLLCSLEGTTITHRWIGGLTDTLQSNSGGAAFSGTCDRLWLPVGTNFRVGMVQVASYTGTNDAGVAGTGASDVTATLFDAEHRCGVANVEGDTIRVSGSGDVAIELLDARRGVWVNTDGSIGTELRVWLTNPSATRLRVPPFTAMRPVLKNTGVANADSLASLTSCEAWYDPPRAARARPPVQRLRR